MNPLDIDPQQMSNEQRFRHLDKEVGEVSNKVARLEAGFSGLVSQFNSLSEEIGERFDQVSAAIRDNQPRPTNLLALGAFAIALLGAATAYVQTRLAPIEKAQERFSQFEIHNLELERMQSRKQGALEERVSADEKQLAIMWDLDLQSVASRARMEERAKWLEKLSDERRHLDEEGLSAIGRLGALEKKVERIDHKGAVRWMDYGSSPKEE